MMLDAEIFVDRIADMQINDMNAFLEAGQRMFLAKQEVGGMTCICEHWNWCKFRKKDILAM